MKYILSVFIATFIMLASCEPKQDTVEDKEAVKNDTTDPREGKGEGEGKFRVAPDKQ